MQSRVRAFKSGSAPIVNLTYLTLVFEVYTDFETVSNKLRIEGLLLKEIDNKVFYLAERNLKIHDSNPIPSPGDLHLSQRRQN